VTQQDLLSQSNLATSLAFQPHQEALAQLLGSGQLQHLPRLSVPKLQETRGKVINDNSAISHALDGKLN